MAPRRRSLQRKGWPANLYCRNGYFAWRNPMTREETGIGRVTKEDAFRQAIEANLWLAKQLNRPRLIDRLTGNAERSFGAWEKRYQEILAGEKYSPNTLRGYRSLGKRAVATFNADTPIRNITPLMVSEALEALGHTRTRQALRSFLFDLFRRAAIKGWVDENPVREVHGGSVEVRRARLEFDVFMGVYQHPDAPVWLRNAMAVAVVAGQRREDISLAKVKDFRDGHWWVEQGKTGSRIQIPFALRLDAFGMSLGDVYQQCRSTGVLSQYLIHQTRPYGNSPRGAQIWKDTISRTFTAVLAKLGADWGEKTPPTFHEIRSLSERLYKAQGGVDTQVLMGHKDPRSTALYDDARGAWVRLRIG